jgi:ABC-2 type transport system ATP-binding protein
MILEVKHLIKRYRDFLALDHISLSVREGEIYGLLGPNGAGKTTTIRILSGLARYDGGEVKILGKELVRHEMEIKRQIGIVPQEIAVFEDLTAYENLDYFGRLYGLRGKELKERIAETLAFVGLADRMKEYPKHFSGGMKRRLNIGSAILHRPKILIMDEPTVGIDPQSRNHILESVRALNRMGSTIIYTSHYMEEVEELCDRIAILDHGRVIAQGTKEELTSLIASEEKIVAEVTAPGYTLVEQIRKIPSVLECTVADNRLEVLAKKGERTVNQIIPVLTAADTEILSIHLERPSLEDVFLTLTGRTLRNA